MTKGNPNKCWYCGHEEKCTKDHFYPKSRGGYDTVYACQFCQSLKRDKTPIEFVVYVNNHKAIKEDFKERISNSTMSFWERIKSKYETNDKTP